LPLTLLAFLVRTMLFESSYALVLFILEGPDLENPSG